MTRKTRRTFASLFMLLASGVAGCHAPQLPPRRVPSVSPAIQPTASLSLNLGDIRPMYQQMLAVDLPTVLRVAQIRSIDVAQAKARLEASRGQYESTVEAIFPVIAPS